MHNQIYFYRLFAPVLLLLFLGCSQPGKTVEYSTAPPRPSNAPARLSSPATQKKVLLAGIANKSIFKDDSLWDVAGDYLTTRLVETGYFRVADWDRMKRDFDPVLLKTGTLVETPDRFASVRRKMDCDYFAGGSITFFDLDQEGKVSALSKEKTITTSVRVDLWIQDAHTGEYLAAASGNGTSVQNFSGGLMGGNFGSWNRNIARKALSHAIDDGIMKLLARYERRPSQEIAAKHRQEQPGGAQNLPPVPPPNLDPDAGVVRKGRKWAIIVGVNQFQDSRINPLNYTDDDAKAMYHFLTHPGYGGFPKEQVFCMINEHATTFNIRLAIDLVSKNAKENDMVLIFISTHGSPRSMDVQGVGYLVTYDTLVDSMYATAFNMQELTGSVKNRIQAKTVILLLDSCYSASAFSGIRFMSVRGAKNLVVETGDAGIPNSMVKGTLTAKGFGIPEQVVRKVRTASGRVIITSSRQNEKSWESDQKGHGFFTYYLLESLRMNQGKTSVQQAYAYMRSNIPKAVMKEKGMPQHPVLGMASVEGQIYLTEEPAN